MYWWPYLINVSINDVEVSDWRDVRRRGPLLFPDHEQNVWLDKEQLVLHSNHGAQLVLACPLHSQHFVVALSVVEWIRPLHEVVHHVVLVQ